MTIITTTTRQLTVMDRYEDILHLLEVDNVKFVDLTEIIELYIGSFEDQVKAEVFQRVNININHIIEVTPCTNLTPT